MKIIQKYQLLKLDILKQLSFFNQEAIQRR